MKKIHIKTFINNNKKTVHNFSSNNSNLRKRALMEMEMEIILIIVNHHNLKINKKH